MQHAARLSSQVSLSLLLAIGAFTAPAGAQPRARVAAAKADNPLDSAMQLQDAFAAVAARVVPSVVAITSYERAESTATQEDRAAGQSNQWREASQSAPYAGFRKLHSGSGLVLGKESHIVTLRQFVVRPNGEPADVVDVETHDGRHHMSRVMGVEPTMNLAVLEFVAVTERNRPECVPATLGNSDSIHVGYWTFALGDPAGPVKAFAAGVLAGLPEQRCYQEQLTATYLQASLKVHSEAYGGPLVNIQGEVVGITTPRTLQRSEYDGLEYALPINIVLPIYEGIRANQSFRSPWLGFAVLEMFALRERLPDPEAFRTMLRPRLGVYIEDVFDPSPASRADIRVGDFLVSFNGQRIFSVYRFQEMLHLTGIGRPAKLEIFRTGETLLKEIVVEERPEAAVPR